MTSQIISLLKLDLIMTGAHPIQSIEQPYEVTDEWLEATIKTYNAMRQASQQKQRIHTLICAYYLGNLIESSITPREKWVEFTKQKSIQNERFTYQGTTRIYQLFKNNIAQIYLTQSTTLRKIAKLNKQQYQELIDFRNEYERDFVI